MEHINYQLSNQQFSRFVSDPINIQADDQKAVEVLLEKFPYSQILHALHAKCLQSTSPEFNRTLKKAALYSPDRTILFNTLNNPAFFKTSFEVSETESSQTVISLEEGVVKELAAIDVFEDDQSTDITHGLEKGGSDTIEAAASATEMPDQPASALEEEIKATSTTPDRITEGTGETDAKKDETEKLIIGNIAATDYFTFEEKLEEQKISEPDITTSIERKPEARTKPLVISEETKEVSKYNDDKMPYTFLWWLSKTRKEYSATYQPYVSFKLDTTEDIKKNAADELNQYIIENIFHLQSPLDDKENEAPKAPEYTLTRKEDVIIDRFIKEEPQIKPPVPDKLDTENKARKSSEDSNEVVSETLAHIYIEQMLFHKAIETYKKLSLKYPEKSAYFALQISKLENR